MNLISENEKVKRINCIYQIIDLYRKKIKDLKKYFNLLIIQKDSVEDYLKEKSFEYNEMLETLNGINKHTKLYYELHISESIKDEIQSKYWLANYPLSDNNTKKIWNGTKGNLISDYQEAYTSSEVLRRAADRFIEIYNELEKEYKFLLKEQKRVLNDIDKSQNSITELQKEIEMYLNLPVDCYDSNEVAYYDVPKKKNKIFNIPKPNYYEYIPQSKTIFMDKFGNAHLYSKKDVLEYEIKSYMSQNDKITNDDEKYFEDAIKNSNQKYYESVYKEEKDPIIYVGSMKR